jgi:tetratricopeptide (TPR) repeat protein
MKRFVLAIIFIGLMVGVGHLQYRHDSHRNYVAEHGTFVTLPSGKTLKIASFGFRNLAADILFIWSIQFYSSYHLTNRYDYLEHIFNVITDLNPLYKEPYIVGSWIMALELGDVDMAIRLLEKGAGNMKDEWIFDYECGFYAYKELKDIDLAEKYFQRAASKPTAPSHIMRKRAHMIYMQDNLEYAYQLWYDILRKAGDDGFARSAALNHLHQIKYEIDKRNLGQKIRQFRQKYGRNPFNLEELKRVRLLTEIPKDFSGGNYIYNNRTGEIKAYKEFKWKKSY